LSINEMKGGHIRRIPIGYQGNIGILLVTPR
jgi:hypothetical protein